MADMPTDQRCTHGLAWIIVPCWLAYWQFRQAWRLVLVMGAITVLANVFICSIPLFSTVASETALRTTFNSTSHPLSRLMRVSAEARVLTPDQIAGVASDLDIAMHQHFGAMASSDSTFTIKSWTYPLFPSKPDPDHAVAAQQMRIVSAPDDVMRAHLDVVRGAFPLQRTDGTLEVVLSQSTAQAWHADVGSTGYLELPPSRQVSKSSEKLLPVAV